MYLFSHTATSMHYTIHKKIDILWLRAFEEIP